MKKIKLKKPYIPALAKIDFHGLVAKLSPGKKMLALEVAGEQILGAVVRAKGKAFTVQNFVAEKRSNAGDDLPDPQNIKEIMEHLDYQSGPAVLVTPLARAVQISMNRAKVEKLKNYQLIESLRWEVEPYTGISGTQALVGMEKPVKSDTDLLLAMEDEDEIELYVSVIEQNVFRALKQLFKKAGLKLTRLYPPDVCFYMVLFTHDGVIESEQAVLDIGPDYANFAILKGRQPDQINTFPIGLEVIRDLLDGEELPDAMENLRFLLGQVPGPLPLILTGSGAIDPQVVDFLGRECASGAEPLVVKRQAKLTEADHDGMNAIYGTVVGAAVRELMNSASRTIGITDAIPLVPRLKKSAYLMPLAVTVLLSLSLFGHYGLMKMQKKTYKAQTKELSSKVKTMQDKQNAYDQAKEESDELRSRISLTKRKIDFVKGGSDENLIHLGRILASLAELPDEMTLESVRQEGGKYLLNGSSEALEVVGNFSVHLQEYDWCRAVAIKIIEVKGSGLLHFQIEMDTDLKE